MKQPFENFLENIELIYQFCRASNNFSTLIVKPENSKNKLYVCPLNLGDESVYCLILFPDLEEAEKFSIFNTTQLDDLEMMLNALNDHGIYFNVFDILDDPSEIDNDKVRMRIYSNLSDEDSDNFNGYIRYILGQDNLEYQFLNESEQPNFGISSDELNGKLLNAILLYPKLLGRNHIRKFKSQTTTKREYFVPVNIDTSDDEDLAAAYLIFPNKKSVGYFFEQIPSVKENPGLGIMTDALLVKFYNRVGWIDVSLIPTGKVESFSDKHLRDLVKDLLLELEQLNEDD